MIDKEQTELKVGPIIYKILQVADLQSSSNDRLSGKINYDVCEILIEAKDSQQARRQTLWHEIVHAILMQLGRGEGHSEDFVDSLAYSLMQVVQDNPWLAETTK